MQYEREAVEESCEQGNDQGISNEIMQIVSSMYIPISYCKIP